MQINVFESELQHTTNMYKSGIWSLIKVTSAVAVPKEDCLYSAQECMSNGFRRHLDQRAN